MPDWIFSGWENVARTIVVGMASYALLLAVLRVSGKRTLSKLNAFDLVVTVALGSTVATILLSREVALVEGIAALVLLVVLQFVVARLSVASPAFARVVKSEPTLLIRRGEMLHDAMRRERVAATELEQAARINGATNIADVEAMILESDGTFSVLGSFPEGHRHLGGNEREQGA